MIKRAEINELSVVTELAAQMWSSAGVSELEEEFKNILKNEYAAFFLKYCGEAPVGFAQCQLRYDYVEGCDISPVGYLEGIYVSEKYRRRGYARELLRVCEQWAALKGCREFASDCELENTDSFRFHMKCGFEEANRIICFKKSLY